MSFVYFLPVLPLATWLAWTWPWKERWWGWPALAVVVWVLSMVSSWATWCIVNGRLYGS